jgi:hypothetical protein
MHKYKIKTGGGTVEIETSASVKYSEATAKRLIEDAIFLYEKSIKATNGLEKRRHSRLAVTVVPYYLESLSKYLFYEFFNRKLKKGDDKRKLSETIKRFSLVYKKCLNKELKDEDVNGIKDIFIIRNKITAHPQGRSRLVATDKGWERDDISITYLKLKKLSQVYSQFNPKHVHLIFTEVHDFLTNYLTAIKGNLTEQQYNYIWPEELITWKLKNPSPPPL